MTSLGKEERGREKGDGELTLPRFFDNFDATDRRTRQWPTRT